MLRRQPFARVHKRSVLGLRCWAHMVLNFRGLPAFFGVLGALRVVVTIFAEQRLSRSSVRTRAARARRRAAAGARAHGMQSRFIGMHD